MDKGTTWLLRGVLGLVLLYFLYAGYERTVGVILTLNAQRIQAEQGLVTAKTELEKVRAELAKALLPTTKEKK